MVSTRYAIPIDSTIGLQSIDLLHQQVIDGKLTFDGKMTFFADKAPRGHGQSKVFLSNDNHPVELQIGWQTAS
jgi:hypothetical protein